MGKFKKDWSLQAKKIEELKSKQSGDYPKIEEDDIYTGLCIGIYYNGDVESTFEGVTKLQDKVGYLFAVKVDKGYALIRKEFTMSSHEKALLPKMLNRFDIDDVNHWRELYGETVRLDVELKKAKTSGKEYAYIDKIKKAKASQDDMVIDGKLEVPAFFFADSEIFEVIDGITIRDDDKGKRKLKKDIDNDNDGDNTEENIPLVDLSDEASDDDFFESLDE